MRRAWLSREQAYIEVADQLSARELNSIYRRRRMKHLCKRKGGPDLVSRTPLADRPARPSNEHNGPHATEFSRPSSTSFDL